MITNRLHTLCIGLAVATAATSCTQAAPPATTPPAVAVAAEVAAPAATEAPMNGLVALPPAVAKYRVDVKQDCGARGDGKANDSAAFREAAVRLQKAGGGTLVIPKGTYIVGEQTHDAGQYPYYKMGLIFEVRSLKGLLIEGNGATLRLAPGLRYGSFDKDMGEPFTPPCNAVHRHQVRGQRRRHGGHPQ